MRSWVILPFIVFGAACSAASNGSGSEPAVGGSDNPTEGPGSGASGGTSSTPSGGSGSSAGAGDGGVPSGVLTAGAWDDNRNYDFFTSYLTANTPLSGSPPIAQSDRDASHLLFATSRAAKQRLDIAIVLDTTGSMGDEAAYLQSEFEHISSTIAGQYPNADMHWALVAYRDTPATDPGDEYVVKSWDFTTDLSMFEGALDGLTAANGGDTPESPDIGLATMNGLSWRSDADVARLAFWVADAPHHDDKAAAMAQDFADSHQKDIHLYPVSASGADELLEITMRSGAQITGGRYLFLTDDSGIGDPHLVPSVPCYFVTKLGYAITRSVSIELSGVYSEPDAAEIIRTGGDPTSGQCVVGTGTVSVF